MVGNKIAPKVTIRASDLLTEETNTLIRKYSMLTFPAFCIVLLVNGNVLLLSDWPLTTLLTWFCCETWLKLPSTKPVLDVTGVADEVLGKGSILQGELLGAVGCKMSLKPLLSKKSYFFGGVCCICGRLVGREAVA